jgi:hypothetical protein
MKLNFCTLFNSAYLTRGIALYESLLNVCPDFHLYVFAFDEDCLNYFKKSNFKNLTVISLKEFEDQELLRIKPSRTAGEYCWTCTSSTILYAINTFSLDHCTYLDADMYFYSDPSVLIEEMGNKSVLITEHRYSPEYEQSERSGKYCVQFITVKNNQKGIEILTWWRNACIDWCYARHEDGKFGDQKYLDDWMTRFDSVHELQHLGGGIAPWNVQQYTFKKENEKLIGNSSGKPFEAIFFHFHGLRFFKNDVLRLTDHGYYLPESAIRLLFIPYAKRLMEIDLRLKKEGITFNATIANDDCPVPVSKFSAAFYYYREGIKSSKRNLLGKGLINNLKNHYYLKTSSLL